MARSMTPNRRRMLGIAPAVIVVGICAAAAFGSPGAGVTPTNLVAKADLDPVHLNSDRVKFQTKGLTAVRFQTLTFQPGAYTGWHHHPGFTLVAVQQGELTIVDSDCNAKAQPAGSAFVEYGDEPLEVRNLGAEPATVYATYVDSTATGPVWRLEDPVHNCP